MDLTKTHALFYIQSKPPTQKYLFPITSSVGKGSEIRSGGWSNFRTHSPDSHWQIPKHGHGKGTCVFFHKCSGHQDGRGTNPVVITQDEVTGLTGLTNKVS